jgi:formylglycine-generating enzyme required for sulfatase activity
MKMRNWFLAVPVILLGVGLSALGEDKPKPKLNLDSILPVPKSVEVATRVELEKKPFTVKLEDEIRVVIDPDFDVDDPDYEKKNIRREKSSASFEMVYIPGGEFLMGSPDSEPGRDKNEGPQHKVTVKPFFLAKYEVSWEVYDLWYRSGTLPRRDEANGKFESDPNNKGKVLPPDAITRPTNPYVNDDYGHGRTDRPAVSMSHHSAMMFCHWLRLKTKLPYRLPTEAEWEYACRAGSTGLYGIPEGEKIGDYAWYKDNSATADKDQGTTHKLGSKKPNKFGLFDMHGNVAEWTLDAFAEDTYSLRAKEALKALTFKKPTEKKWGHVVRGGSWVDAAEDLRSAKRVVSEEGWMGEDPQFPRSVWWLTKMDNIGFRVALPVEEYPELVGLMPMVPKKGR